MYVNIVNAGANVVQCVVVGDFFKRHVQNGVMNGVALSAMLSGGDGKYLKVYADGKMYKFINWSAGYMQCLISRPDIWAMFDGHGGQLMLSYITPYVVGYGSIKIEHMNG